MDTPSACERCARCYPTCCRTDPALAHLCFPLSEAEWQRIKPYEAEAGGLPGREEDENSPVFVSAMKRLFPGHGHHVEALFPVPGKRWRLGTDSGGDCVFLGPEGCRLPRNVRPWYCRLFPIWAHNKRLDFFTADECVVAEEARTVGEAMRAVGLTAEEARELSACLYRDWGFMNTE